MKCPNFQHADQDHHQTSKGSFQNRQKFHEIDVDFYFEVFCMFCVYSIEIFSMFFECSVLDFQFVFVYSVLDFHVVKREPAIGWRMCRRRWC